MMSVVNLPGVPQAQPSNILATNHLCRTINGVTLVSDIPVELRAGEVLAVVGPSGSGKEFVSPRSGLSGFPV